MKKLLSRLSQARTVMLDPERPKGSREDVEREAADEISRATGRSGGPSTSEVPAEAPSEVAAGNGEAFAPEPASEAAPDRLAPDRPQAEPVEEPDAPRPVAATRTPRSKAGAGTRKAPAKGRSTGATGRTRKPAAGAAGKAASASSRKAAATPAKPRRPAAKSPARKRQG